MKKSAFSLAEVLLTLAIVGIIAVLTIPSLLHDYTKRKYATAYKNMYATIINGFGLLIAEENQAGHDSTEDFVKVMENYFNVGIICENDKLKDCFGEKITTPDKIIDISQLKTAKDIGNNWTTDTNINGIMLSNGMCMLVAYNKDGCLEQGKSKEDILKSCVSIVFDIDGPEKGGSYLPLNEKNEPESDICLYNASLSVNAD